MERDHVERLQRAGVEIGTYNPVKWYSIEEINYRTHRKILVIDGDVAFTGGAGVADHWLGDADSPEHWRDTHLRVTGPAVRCWRRGSTRIGRRPATRAMHGSTCGLRHRKRGRGQLLRGARRAAAATR